MEERNGREASRWPPVSAVHKGTALRAQCISQGISASNLTSLCRQGDGQSLTIGPSALLARSESGMTPRNSGASNRVLLPGDVGSARPPELSSLPQRHSPCPRRAACCCKHLLGHAYSTGLRARPNKSLIRRAHNLCPFTLSCRRGSCKYAKKG
eukprot:6185513-Pleurochrysis_carterae.AAC.5